MLSRMEKSVFYALCGCINTFPSIPDPGDCKSAGIRFVMAIRSKSACETCTPLIPILPADQLDDFKRRVEREYNYYRNRLPAYRDLLQHVPPAERTDPLSIPGPQRPLIYRADRTYYSSPLIRTVPSDHIRTDKEICGICRASMKQTIAQMILNPDDGCQGSYGGSVSMLPCGHAFGQVCLTEMLSYPGLDKCPACTRKYPVIRVRPGIPPVGGAPQPPVEPPPGQGRNPRAGAGAAGANNGEAFSPETKQMINKVFVLFCIWGLSIRIPIPLLGWSRVWPMLAVGYIVTSPRESVRVLLWFGFLTWIMLYCEYQLNLYLHPRPEEDARSALPDWSWI